MMNIKEAILSLMYNFLSHVYRHGQWVKYHNLLNNFKSIGSDSQFDFTEYEVNHPECIEIGTHCSFGKGARLLCLTEYREQVFTPCLKIGNYVSINNDCQIACIDNVSIGNNVLVAARVFITDHFYGQIVRDDTPPSRRPLTSKPVLIGNNVWLGENVSIMPGVSLGDNVIVGANAVVTHSFPNNVVIAGVPAKVIKIL